MAWWMSNKHPGRQSSQAYRKTGCQDIPGRFSTLSLLVLAWSGLSLLTGQEPARTEHGYNWSTANTTTESPITTRQQAAFDWFRKMKKNRVETPRQSEQRPDPKTEIPQYTLYVSVDMWGFLLNEKHLPLFYNQPFLSHELNLGLQNSIWVGIRQLKKLLLSTCNTYGPGKLAKKTKKQIWFIHFNWMQLVYLFPSFQKL